MSQYFHYGMSALVMVLLFVLILTNHVTAEQGVPLIVLAGGVSIGVGSQNGNGSYPKGGQAA